MSSNSPTDPPSQSPRRGRWRKVLAILAFVVAFLATGIAAFYLIERQCGRAAWEAYEAEAKARGVKLLLTDYVLPPVPDAENFAAIPLFDEVFRAQAACQPVPNPLALPQVEGVRQPPFDNSAKQQRIDLAAWQTFFLETKVLTATTDHPARDVLTALEKYDAPLAQLREAGARPHCRFPVRYEDLAAAALPHLAIFRSASRVYVLRMAAHLALEEHEKALDDFRQALRLYTATAQEPTLIACLVRVALLWDLENAIWGGLAAGQWSDAELREIERALASLRLFADYRLGIGSERGFGNAMHEVFHTQSSGQLAEMLRGISVVDGNSGNNRAHVLMAWSLYPRGWLYRSQLRSNLFLDEMLARISVDPPRVELNRPVAMDRDRSTGSFERMRYLFFYLVAPALKGVERKYAFTQTLTDHTRIACALERHRLARGEYPEALAKVAPEFLPALPADVLTGESLRYRRTDAGRFVLYSVGLNLQDDGGTTGGRSSSNDQLDWVWEYPAR